MSEATFTLEQLNEIVALVQRGNGGGRKRKGRGFARPKPTAEETELRRKANDEECIRKFTAAGYKDVKPRVNVLTYGKTKPDGTQTGWKSKGRQVRKGEKGLSVGPFVLFHESQTDPITAPTAPSVGAVAAAPASAVSAAPKAEVKAAEPPKSTPTEAKKNDWTEWNS